MCCVCVCVCVCFPCFRLCCLLIFQNSSQTRWWEGFLVFVNFSSFRNPSPEWVWGPNSFVSLFLYYILSYFLLKRVGCLSGCLVSSASIQKLFCGSCSSFKWSFDEFVGKKVVSLSHSSTIFCIWHFKSAFETCLIEYVLFNSFLLCDFNKPWRFPMIRFLSILLPFDFINYLLLLVVITTARTIHGTTDLLQIRKGVCQGCILSPCLFNFYAEYIMRNTSLDEKHKLESRLLGEISNSIDMQMTPPLWQKVKKNQRASWWKWKRRVKKLA